MKENVFILTDAFRPNIGGVETHLDDLCEYLRKNGHYVFVVTYQPLLTKARGLKVERKKNLEIRRMQWFGHNLEYKLDPYPMLRFLHMFPGLLIGSFFILLKHRKKIDVIHAQGLIAGFVAKILNKIFRKRCVVTLHAIFNFHQRSLVSRWVNWILSSFDAIISLSGKSKAELITIGLSEEKVKLCTHWVDLDRFKPMDKHRCKEELNLTEKFVVLFVGRLIAIKGVELLLDAAPIVNPEITFALIGDGPLAKKIEERAKTQENIVFLGRVTEEDKPKYYNVADVSIIPSQYEELYGRVIIEALACGVPVIASNRGTLPEVVDPSIGRVINPTVGNIVKVVNFLYERPEELERMRLNCRPYALAHFSERNAELIINTYKQTD